MVFASADNNQRRHCNFKLPGLQIFYFQETIRDMKKVLIATGIYPPDIGGPTAMVGALADALRTNNFAVKIITYASRESVQEKVIDVIKIKRTKIKFFSFFNYFFYIVKLALWADIIYATDTYSVGYFAYLMKRIFNKKYIIRFAGDSAWEAAVSEGLTDDNIVDFQKKKHNDRIEKLKIRRQIILKNADQVIAVSNFLADLLKLIEIEADKITMIYNSVDFFSEIINQQQLTEIKNKYGAGTRIMITVCRLTPWKGVDGIIRALPKLIERIGPVNFLVLGDGEEMNNLKKITADSRMENNVHFLGRVNHGDTLAYMAAADLFILNSNYEGLSHVLLEAIKMGAPIAASNVGGNPEVIDDSKNGLLFGYNNEKEILSATSKILFDTNYAKQLVVAANEKLKIFNWSENVKATINLVNKLLS